jgi:sulfite exporter TauE/SafE
MISLIVAIFAASVLGSLHCVGMCGAFLALAITTPGIAQSRWSHARLQSAYHAGRLITYTLLGAAAGAIGAAVDRAAALGGVERVAATTAAILLLIFAITALLRTLGVVLPRVPLPAGFTARVAGLHRRAMDLPPTTRALTIGLLTTLLPCGWLYAFAAAAAGTGHVLTGAAAMAVFWLGTLPVLVGLGVMIKSASGRLGRSMPLISSVALLLVAGMTAAGRIGLLSEQFDFTRIAPLGAVTDASTIQRVSESPLPCCNPTP